MTELIERGFRKVGSYHLGRFEIDPEWRAREVVYAWVSTSGATARIVRVGIACGRSALGGRYALYNRWLAGTFKQDDAREQRIRRMFLEGLSEQAQVWALPVVNKSAALALEKELRAVWRSTLDLDGMVRGGRFGQTMKAWRLEADEVSREPRPPQRRAVDPPPDQGLRSAERADVNRKLVEVEDWVRRAFHALAAAANSTTFREESGPGRRLLNARGATICRLHPKIAHLAVGFPNAHRNEVAQTGLLRPQKDAAWINVTCEADVPTAEAIIRRVAQ